MFLTYLTPNQDQRDCEEVQRPKHHPCTIPRGGQVDKQHVPNIFPIHIILYMFQICFLDISDDFSHPWFFSLCERQNKSPKDEVWWLTPLFLLTFVKLWATTSWSGEIFRQIKTFSPAALWQSPIAFQHNSVEKYIET